MSELVGSQLVHLSFSGNASSPDPSARMSLVGDEGLELLPFSTGSRAICVERDAESDAYLHEKVVVEQFKLLQPLFSADLKQALISELVGSLACKYECP